MKEQACKDSEKWAGREGLKGGSHSLLVTLNRTDHLAATQKWPNVIQDLILIVNLKEQ